VIDKSNVSVNIEWVQSVPAFKVVSRAACKGSGRPISFPKEVCAGHSR
jgi:hypothetical protein